MSNEWSNDATTSLTLPTGATDPNQRIVLDGTSDTILVYNSTGALIASVAATAGSDGFGNSYPAGISATSGIISQSIILLYNGTPALGNLIISLTSSAGSDSFGNVYQAGFTVYDGSGNTIRNIDITGLDTIGAGTGSQFVIDPTNGQIRFYNSSGVLTGQIVSGNGSILFYTSTTTTSTFTSSGSFVVPANVNSIRAQVWGAGGGGQYGSGAGGGGGEYAEEPSLSVTPGETLTVTIGTGGAGGTSGSPHGVTGGNSLIQRSSTTLVIAHGGQGSSSATTIGGTGSTNTIHHDGGGSHANTTGLSQGGAGGGESGAPTVAGNPGQSNVGSTGGAGGSGTAGSNGGAGGNGTGTTGTAGSVGTLGGGGGGAGGSGSVSGSNGAAGTRGQAFITYTNTAVLEVSIAAVAGTDQFGNSYPQGIQVGIPTGSRIYLNPSGPNMDTYNTSNKLTGRLDASAGTQTYLDNTNLQFLSVSIGNSSTAGSGILMGKISSAGTLPTSSQQNNAAFVAASPFINQLLLDSGNNGTNSAVNIEMDAGTTSGTIMTPGTSPQLVVSSGPFAVGPTLCVTDGAWVFGNGGGAGGWQTPSYNTNWKASTTFNGNAGYESLRYRIDAEDNVWLVGAFKANTTSPGTGAVFNLPTGYRPQSGVFPIFCQRNTGPGTLTIGTLYINTNGNVDVFASTGLSVNANDEFLVNGKFPLGNIS